MNPTCKLFFGASVVLFTVNLVVGCNSLTDDAQRSVLVIGHRGYSSQFPENTMRSFKECVAAGGGGIEMDIRATADGVLVALHDATVDRTTDGSGRVEDMTWDQVSKLNAANRHNETFLGERIPRLEQILDEFRGKDVFLLLELKTDAGLQVAAIVAERKMEGQCLIRSFNVDRLDTVKARFPQMVTQRIYYEYDGWQEAIDKARRGGHSITFRRGQVTSEKVQAAHDAGMIVFVSTVNSPDEIRELIEMGVDGVIGDYVDRLVEVKKSLKFAQPKPAKPGSLTVWHSTMPAASGGRRISPNIMTTSFSLAIKTF